MFLESSVPITYLRTWFVPKAVVIYLLVQDKIDPANESHRM